MELKCALKSFFGDEDRAVSPVIGVILMVAITVILAAVIGTFVLGLGDRVSQASPNTNFGFEYSTANSNNIVKISHDGGDGVEASQLNVSVGGTDVWGGQDQWNHTNVDESGSWSGKVTAGDTITLKDTGTNIITDGATVQVIWHADGSDKTAVIGESEVSL